MFYSILMTLDVLLAIGVIALVLLQHGRGADAGAAFGSGSSATVFGARGSASFLSRATAILAALFFINSLGLAYTISHHNQDTSVVEQAGGESKPSQSGEVPSQQQPRDTPAPEPQPAPSDNDQPADVPR